MRDVDQDARGIIAPDSGLAHFRLERRAPAPDVARLVDRYWLARWDLAEPFTQRVLAHPVVNVVFQPDGSGVYGVATRVQARRLTGRSWALGVMFRPAGFRPLLGRAMAPLRDAELAVTEVLGGAAGQLDRRVRGLADPAEGVRLVEEFLRARLPAARHPAEDTAALVERIAADPTVARVERVAAEEQRSVRQLQRRFADHVGLSPKRVIRRYRLYEAAEQARHRPVDWAALAAALGYSDQAHLTRDFTTVFGAPPRRYLRQAAPR